MCWLLNALVHSGGSSGFSPDHLYVSSGTITLVAEVGPDHLGGSSGTRSPCWQYHVWGWQQWDQLPLVAAVGPDDLGGTGSSGTRSPWWQQCDQITSTCMSAVEPSHWWQKWEQITLVAVSGTRSPWWQKSDLITLVAAVVPDHLGGSLAGVGPDHLEGS